MWSRETSRDRISDIVQLRNNKINVFFADEEQQETILIYFG